MGLPLMNRFDKRKQFLVDPNEARYNPNCIAHLGWIGRGEDGAERGLRCRFEHRLALFVEACLDGVVFFEADEQGWQGRLVVTALFEVLPR